MIERDAVIAGYTDWLNEWVRDSPGGPYKVKQKTAGDTTDYRWEMFTYMEPTTHVIIFHPKTAEIAGMQPCSDAKKRAHLHALFAACLQKVDVAIGPLDKRVVCDKTPTRLLSRTPKTPQPTDDPYRSVSYCKAHAAIAIGSGEYKLVEGREEMDVPCNYHRV